MIQAIRMAIKYSDVLPVAVELVEEIYESISDDGTISTKERSRLMKKYWKVVHAVQAAHNK